MRRSFLIPGLLTVGLLGLAIPIWRTISDGGPSFPDSRKTVSADPRGTDSGRSDSPSEASGGGPGSPENGAIPERVRIISLSPNLTETLYALGAEDMLLAVTDCCDRPVQAKRKPIVGAYGRPDPERILTFSPTDILTTERIPPELSHLLETSGITVHTLRIGELSSVYRMFREVGRITGRERVAEELVVSVESRFRSAREMVANRFSRPPRLFCELWSDPLTTIGRESYLTDVIEQIGAVNVGAQIRSAYPVISAEKVLEWDPDQILVIPMMSGTAPTAPLETMRERIGWETLRAIRSNRVIADLPTELLLRPGPGIGQGALAIAERLCAQPVNESR